MGEGAELVSGDPAVAVGDVFEAGDLEAGAFLDDFDEDGGLREGVVGAGVQPGEAAPEGLDLELAVGEEGLVHGGDFQLAARGGLDAFRDLHHLVRVEVEADDGVIALRVRRFLFDAEAIAGGVELGYAVAFGVGDPIAEDGGLPALSVGDGGLQQAGEAVAVEDVVAQHQAGGIVADELLADEEGLRESVRRRLLRVFEAHAVVGAVAQQAPEAGQVLGRADDEDLPDARQHQHADGIIHHGLVVDGQQLLADALRDRIEAGAGASGEDDSFHILAVGDPRSGRG